ncbi:hypothetical protein I4641_07800 [Waterburya agarophytonicola K14]|uniref:Uncharacterized protein n=1 Tax=Waterburya agarophytonicola KI4 TaxID=2874699 RepID=A0A964BP82_9CYAN|nr:hypothetical protein [Waterburya agarophytonicola]MCC0176880.1 hypothetical protein [Waterburya agarophytonicola KI4]
MPFFQLRKITQVLSNLAPFICLAGIVFLQSQEYKKSAQQLNYDNYVERERQQAKEIDLLQQSPHLGFDNLVADWSYLNFVQYFGDAHARETIGYQLVPEYFATITNIDPRFTQAHLRLSIANSMYAGNAEKTVALMEKVLATVDPESPQSALLWTSKGLDELLFLGNKKAAINSYKIAAQWANLTQSDRPDGLTIKDLEQALTSTSEIDLKQAQIRAWSSVLVHIRDNQKKQEIIRKITNLKSEIAILEQSGSRGL